MRQRNFISPSDSFLSPILVLFDEIDAISVPVNDVKFAMVVLSATLCVCPGLEIPASGVHCPLVILVLGVVRLDCLGATVVGAALVLTVLGDAIVTPVETLVNVVTTVPLELPSLRTLTLERGW